MMHVIYLCNINLCTKYLNGLGSLAFEFLKQKQKKNIFFDCFTRVSNGVGMNKHNTINAHESYLYCVDVLVPWCLGAFFKASDICTQIQIIT